jgi:O-antigen/teichoic acid export membrane protein
LRSFLSAISRGAGIKLGSDIVGRLLQYVLLWAAALKLSEAGFGDFSLALSLGYMVAQVADFGLQLFVQRELSRLADDGSGKEPRFADPDAAGRLVGGGLLIKGVLSVVALIIIGLLLWLQPVEQKPALMLVGLSMVLATVLEYLSYCFRALRKLHWEAAATVIGRATNLAVGIGLLFLGAGVWGLALASNAAMMVAIAFAYVVLRRYVRPIWSPDWRFWRGQAWQPTALGAGIVFSMISFRIDNLLIAPLVGRAELGNYNVAYKLFEPSLLVPSVILAAAFPLLSKAAAQREQRPFRGYAQNTMLLLFGLGTLATTSMFALSVPVINLLYGARYESAGGMLQVLAFACLPMYLNYGLTHLLIALDKPQLYAFFTLAGLITNVTANLVLLPSLGAPGAAIATILAEGVLFALCALAVWRTWPRTNLQPRYAVATHPEREPEPEGSF